MTLDPTAGVPGPKWIEDAIDAMHELNMAGDILTREDMVNIITRHMPPTPTSGAGESQALKEKLKNLRHKFAEAVMPLAQGATAAQIVMNTEPDWAEWADVEAALERYNKPQSEVEAVLEIEVEQLRRFLLKYGDHTKDCQSHQMASFPTSNPDIVEIKNKPCTCHWNDLRAKLQNGEALSDVAAALRLYKALTGHNRASFKYRGVEVFTTEKKFTYREYTGKWMEFESLDAVLDDLEGKGAALTGAGEEANDAD
jgi:hypothetical protein